MKCPKCDEPTYVLQNYSKAGGHTIARRRACRVCEYTFWTQESPVESPEGHVKITAE